MVSSTPRPHFTTVIAPIPILQEAGWAPGSVWTGGKSRPHRDSIPDRPARSQSLYRLGYRTHIILLVYLKNKYGLELGRRFTRNALYNAKGHRSLVTAYTLHRTRTVSSNNDTRMTGTWYKENRITSGTVKIVSFSDFIVLPKMHNL